MKKFRITITVLLIIVLFVRVMAWINTPERKTIRFVNEYSAALAELLDNEQPIPAELSVKCYSTWDAEHPMDEFILYTWGNTYYGCYYSQDDVPLAFQNSNVPLIDDGKDCWQWRSQGDNHGITRKIADKWYYFEASF